MWRGRHDASKSRNRSLSRQRDECDYHHVTGTTLKHRESTTQERRSRHRIRTPSPPRDHRSDGKRVQREPSIPSRIVVERRSQEADSHSSINNPNDERVDRLECLVKSLLTDKISRRRDSFVMKSDCTHTRRICHNDVIAMG
ncbi:hypothetical protein Zmor_005920 [Zophobas morio]|uniref:Uncharacterized protein n=1 Tax=Zophobas morio TaxID=2755281 RepID=A0AA38IWN1_9CUCU|nr:hypothetical protein Zmor_005920 [Zophobas morio]